MSTKQEVLDAIAQEKQEVSEKLVADQAALDLQASQITDLNKTIQDLKDQIAAGTAVTPADLDDILNAVHGIFTPDAPATPAV